MGEDAKEASRIAFLRLKVDFPNLNIKWRGIQQDLHSPTRQPYQMLFQLIHVTQQRKSPIYTSQLPGRERRLPCHFSWLGDALAADLSRHSNQLWCLWSAGILHLICCWYWNSKIGARPQPGAFLLSNMFRMEATMSCIDNQLTVAHCLRPGKRTIRMKEAGFRKTIPWTDSFWSLFRVSAKGKMKDRE